MSTANTTSSPRGGKSPSVGTTIHSTGYNDNSRLYDFDHLEDDGNNYVSWKYQTRSALRLLDLWGIVNGDIPMPDPSAPSDERDEWSYKDQEAQAQITHTLNDRPLNYILDATTAKECWDKLSAWFKRNWDPQIGLLTDKVFRSTLSDSEPIGPQMRAILSASDTIRCLGLELDDKLVAQAIISSLPPSLSTLTTIILCTTNPSELSTARVISQVTFDERRRVSASGLGATEFFARAAKKGKSSRRRPKTGSSEGR